MTSDAARLWRAPRWALALLLACLAMLAPFAIDTYLPAFTAIGRSIGATPVEMQQTLSAYLFGFALMNLFHGALADSFGRRPVVLAGVAAFTVASAGCALATDIGALVFWRAVQGLSAGAGIVVGRAVIRDVYEPADAQRAMAQVTLWFGVAPAIAPVIGGLLVVHVGWASIFWFLVAIGAALYVAVWRLLPETLAAAQRQPFDARHLLRGYRQLGADPRFLALALASGVPFNGMFIYVLAAPVFLGEHLGLDPEGFWRLFLLVIGGIMAGSWCSGRLAGRIAPRRQVRIGFAVMAVVGLANVAANLAFPARVGWALWPISAYSFGWALMMPSVTLMVLDLVPERRGMASSLQMFVGSAANGLVAGVVAPLAMHSTAWLAAASFAMLAIGAVAWRWVAPRVG